MVETFLVTLITLGFILGLEHALDADHVAAVSAMVSRTKSLKKSSALGAVWGMGHTTTLLLVGLLVLVFKVSLPQNLAPLLEFLAGIVLVLLGIGVLRNVIRDNGHMHGHKHENIEHSHLHSREGAQFHRHMHKTFAIGMLHGLAGSGTLMILVLATVKSVVEGLLYILVFGAGSILGMLLISTIIGLSFVLTNKFEKIHSIVRTLAGAISIILGLAIMYDIGRTGLLA